MYENSKLLELITFLFKVLLNYLFIELVAFLFDLYYLDILKNNGEVSQGLQIYWNVKTNVVNFCSRFLPIIFGTIFIGWFYREYWNTQYLLNQYEFRYNPTVAIFAFLIPIFNLFAPYYIMNEIIKGYEVYYNRRINESYVKVWWFGYVFYIIYTRILTLSNAKYADEVTLHTYHLIASDLIGITSLVFLILILRQLKPSLIKNSL